MYDDLLRNSHTVPETRALDGERGLTYRELADLALRTAAGLRAHGLRPGDRVAILLPNLPELVVALYATTIAGGVAIPLNVLLMPPELRYVIEDSGVRLLIVLDGLVPMVRASLAGLHHPPSVVVVGGATADDIPFTALATSPVAAAPPPCDPSTHVLTIYTSGTTGRPKGAMLSAGNVKAQTEMIGGRFAPETGERVLCVLPLFHVFALSGILSLAMRYRGTTVLHPRFEVSRCLASLAHDDIAWFAGVPTMYSYILRHAEAGLRFPALRMCFSGGAALPTALAHAFEERFGLPIYNGYGLTETTAAVCLNAPGPGGHRAGSIGRPYEGVEIRVVDEGGHEVPVGIPGELLVRGASVMMGYFNQPQATADALRAGWLHTGDVGYRDEDGFYYLVDRLTDVIVKGGYKIYPREIEDVLCQLDDVLEAAAVGVPDPEKGERVCAIVVPRPGQQVSEEALRQHVQRSLAKYKHPHHYLLWEALPKGTTGKVLKKEIRQRLTHAAAAENGSDAA
jgi:long-chain acyl-CoA synthetase